WFAREPNAESLTLPLLFGGWTLLERALREPARRDLAAWAGLCLGLVALNKLEFLALPAILYVYFMLRSFVRPLRPNEKVFLLAYSVLTGHAAAHFMLISSPYLRTLRDSLNNSHFISFSTALAGGLVLLLGVLLLVLLRRPLGRLLGRLLERPALSRDLVSALWLLLALYGAVLWPLLGPARVYAYEQWWPNLNRWSFLRMAWYLSTPGLVLGILGLWWWLRHRRGESFLPMVGLLFFQLGVYIHSTLADPFHFWMMRRYLPLIFPCLTVGIAAALWRLRRAPLGPALRRGGALLLLGLLLLLSVRADATFAGRRDLPGVRSFLAELAEQVPDGAPLLIEPMGAALTAPLRYLYGRAAYALPQAEFMESTPAIPWPRLWSLLREWPPGSDTAYLLLKSPPMNLSGGTTVEEVGRFDLDSERLEQSYDHLPRQSVPIRVRALLYRVQQRTGSPHELEVSFLEPLWSGGGITITMPAPDVPLRLRLQAAGFRPEPLPPARLELYWSGEWVAERELERSFQIEGVEIWLPPPAAPLGSPVSLEIRCQTWNPQEAGFGQDDRSLGILLQSLTLEQE
ncbi:MAG: hypothetical protein JXA37_05980, partial [Chloroflexia bacterium]|nr:hypothetical protein [Chloroflexia bacterium]